MKLLRDELPDALPAERIDTDKHHSLIEYEKHE
jgi:hypothetical protein